VVLIIDLYLLK